LELNNPHVLLAQNADANACAISSVASAIKPDKADAIHTARSRQNERGARGGPSATIPPEEPIMKRTILYTTVALAAFASGYVGSSSNVDRTPKVMRVAEFEACLTETGKSGYMVSGGRGPECVEYGQS
jgi:hypothetical protein